jgi:DNA replication protein DnaC
MENAEVLGRGAGASISKVEIGKHTSYLPTGGGSCRKRNWSYRDFLTFPLTEEVAHRNQTHLQRGTRNAHFPFFNTIDEFDFHLQSTLRQSLLGS